MAETSTPEGEGTNGQQPGQVIRPGQPDQARPPETTFKFTPDESTVAQPEPQTQPQAQPQSQVPNGSDPASAPAPAADGISWTAAEFITHEKSAGWYALLMIVTAIVIAVVYWLTKDKVSAAVVLVCAFALAMLAGRQPRQLEYKVDGSGITVGHKHFEYDLFKSFAVVPEGSLSSIIFMPLRRFAPLTTIYYSPEDEEQIVNVLSNRLPLEPHKLDVVDTLMRRIRF